MEKTIIPETSFRKVFQLDEFEAITLASRSLSAKELGVVSVEPVANEGTFYRQMDFGRYGDLRTVPSGKIAVEIKGPNDMTEFWLSTAEIEQKLSQARR